MNSSIRLDDYREENFLNLDRCLIQPSSIDQISHCEILTGISLAWNYLIEIPNFVSDYTNLIELNVNHNELYETEFLLYRNGNSNDQLHRPLVHPFLQKIDLSFNHIKTLPSNIHYLRFLHTLDLSSNSLEELPNTIGYLEQLHRLILENNSLKILPSTVTRLNQLEELNLAANQLQSVDILKNFERLRAISLSSNPLKTFPILLNTCLNLEEIDLSNIQLNQRKEIQFEYFSTFAKLRKLNLSNNNLTNQFLSTANQPSNTLEELYFQSNQFTTIFSLLSTLKSLYLLDLSSNSLTNLPECFNSRLKILRLSNNHLELTPHECVYLKSIAELDLAHNEIKQIPGEFLHCIHLQSLNISSNPLEKYPEILLQLRSLNRLSIDACDLKYLPGSDLMKKYFSRTLNSLDLSGNDLHTNLVELTGLKALTYLDLSRNQLSELHQDFRLMVCLKVMKLGKNRFLKFPNCLYQMSNDRDQNYINGTLLELSLNDNQLKSIPEDIIHMTALHTIDLSNNQFPIFPESLVYLEQLSSMVYSQEKGTHIDKLPEDFLQLYNLKILDLSHNTFFEIPSMIYALKKLQYLNMSYNLLTAFETNRLQQMSNLKELKLTGNEFPSFPSALYHLERFDITENARCIAPPNDFIRRESASAVANQFVQIHDQYEEKLFELYKQICIENLLNSDIERLLIRLKLSNKDMTHFRTNSHQLKREEKVKILFHLWKEKRHSLANADTLYKLTEFIGDKKLLQQMKKAYLMTGRIRI